MSYYPTVYGEIFVKDSTTTITVDNTGFVQVASFDSNGESNGMTPDHTSDDITATYGGKYLVDVSLVIQNTSGSAHEVEIQCSVNSNATSFNNVHGHRTLGAGTDKGSITMNGIVDLVAADTLELWIQSDSGVSRDIVVEDCTLSARRMDE